MKTLTAIVIAILVTLSCSYSWAAQNGPEIPTGSLNETETANLVLMREEEKLARDAYITLYDLWGMKLFLNISSSEQKHMDAMLKMLNRYSIADPVVSDETGLFSNSSLAALYQELIDRGDNSQLEALQVGAYVEEMDIRDLRSAIAYTDEAPLINSYSNLLAASRNHLRIFVSHIESLGVDYVAQILNQSDVDDIVSDYNVIPGENFTMNAGLNDAWYYPETDGQGFLITVYPDQATVFLAWFTFDTELPSEDSVVALGDLGQRWMTAQGSYNGGQAVLDIHFAIGGVFDSDDPKPENIPAGSILLQFEDCASGSVTYDIPSIDRAGVIPIIRVGTDNIPLCQELNAITQ